MRKSMKTLLATGIIAASVAGAPAVFAATQSDNTQDAGQMDHKMQGRSQMQEQGQMGNGMGMMNNGNMNGNMMPMMQMMTQMNQMMANCNQMMQGMMSNHHGPKSGSGSDKG